MLKDKIFSSTWHYKTLTIQKERLQDSSIVKTKGLFRVYLKGALLKEFRTKKEAVIFVFNYKI